MLSSMHIENIAVIRKLDIDFPSGFTSITGETGAGKSIVIDSIKLLLGVKASRELIRTGENTATVSALFSDIGEQTRQLLHDAGCDADENNELFLQRTITSDGRSYAKVNSRGVPLSLLRDAGRLLIGIYGQHDSVILTDTEKHIVLLDAFADDEKQIEEYKATYSQINEYARKIKELSRDAKEKERLCEMLRYQIKDIDDAKLKPGEDEALETQRLKIKNAEQLFRRSRTVYRALLSNEKGTTASALIDIARGSIEQMAEVFPELLQDAQRLTEIRYEIEAIADKAKSLSDVGVDDPVKTLDAIESRLDTISKLKRKYGDTVAEITANREKYAEQLESLEGADALIGEYAAKTEALYTKAVSQAEIIREARMRAASELENGIMRELSYLDLEKVKFKVGFTRSTVASGKTKLLQDGIDTVEFLISTNTGEPLKPLSKIASGGELSRIMLALKVVFAGKESTPTLIFDEIDTGISGKTSQKIGFKLAEIGKSTQIFCVTHSAQTASVATSQLRVSKSDVDGRTETSVKLLDREERIGEIARIMGGVDISGNIIESAKEMLGYSEN